MIPVYQRAKDYDFIVTGVLQKDESLMKFGTARIPVNM